MKHLYNINNFYHSLKDISIVNKNLDKKRESLRKYVYEYNENIQKIYIDKGLLKKNKEIGKLLNETLNILKAASNGWIENFNKILEKEKFRSYLENHFIVIIFGKVKAGKSSLGNFIAQNRPANEKVSFFKYDEAGSKEQGIKKPEEIDDAGFDTDNLECTVAIQGFKLNAMAWIDTPGLSSMVEENGKLAKEYIESADYIIYPTSSDSPLQADEISQLKELFEQNKKVSICINKSDKFERRKNNSGDFIKKDGKIAKFLINKPIENRLKQEKYVREEIAKINKNQSVIGDVISISTHTAKQGLKERNDELLENSNIPMFYDLITNVVKEKASKLKSETPCNGLKAFINNDVLGINDRKFTIKTIREKINDLEKNSSESKSSLNIVIDNIKSDIHREVNDVVEKYYTKIDKYNSQEMFERIDKEIASIVSNIIENNIQKIFESFSYSLNNLATSIGGDEFRIDDIHEEYTYSTKDRNKNIGSAILGTVATIVAAVATGGASLVVAAGAAIAAGGTGAYLGGKAGEMTGSQYTATVNIGDNKEKVIQKFKESQITIHSDNSEKVYKKIIGSFFNPLTNMMDNMKNELDKFEKSIILLKEELV